MGGRHKGTRRASRTLRARRVTPSVIVNLVVAAVVAAVTVVVVHATGHPASGEQKASAATTPSAPPGPSSTPSDAAGDDVIAKPSITPIPTPTGDAFLTAHLPVSGGVDPNQGQAVALGLWSIRRAAMRARSIAGLRQIERGAALTADTDVLACGCVHASVLQPVRASAVVPAAKGFPVSFLGEVEFARDDGSEGVELMVIERVSASDKWHITLVSGFPVDDDNAAVALDETGWAGDVGTPLGADGKGLSDLAALWQATKNAGTPADVGSFDDQSYYTSDFLKEIAKTRQDSLQGNGLRAHVAFTADAAVPIFAVEASTGDVACGAIVQTTTYTPSAGHSIKQDDGRMAFGAALAPGAYKSVTESIEWEICVEQAGGSKRAVLAWDQSDEPGVGGVRAPTGSGLTADPAQKLVPDATSDDDGSSTT